MMEWIIILAIVIAMYIIIYNYEKKMDALHKLVQENKDNINNNSEKINENREHIDDHHDRIKTNHSRLEKHHSHIERMWITIPEKKKEN
jgi:uncharacterized protein (UPF0333 family)